MTLKNKSSAQKQQQDGHNQILQWINTFTNQSVQTIINCIETSETDSHLNESLTLLDNQKERERLDNLIEQSKDTNETIKYLEQRDLWYDKELDKLLNNNSDSIKHKQLSQLKKTAVIVAPINPLVPKIPSRQSHTIIRKTSDETRKIIYYACRFITLLNQYRQSLPIAPIRTNYRFNHFSLYFILKKIMLRPLSTNDSTTIYLTNINQEAITNEPHSNIENITTTTPDETELTSSIDHHKMIKIIAGMIIGVVMGVFIGMMLGGLPGAAIGGVVGAAIGSIAEKILKTSQNKLPLISNSLFSPNRTSKQTQECPYFLLAKIT